MVYSARTKKSRGGLAPNKYFSDEQVKQLREFIEARAKVGGHRAVLNRIIIDVLLNSGLRAAELCSLQMRDLPHHHGKLIIDVRKGKGCVQRSVEISSALAKRIKRFIRKYRKGAKPRSFLFVNENGGQLSYRSLYSRLKIIGSAAGIGDLRAHMLRHTYATAFYNQTKDLLMLQDQLGHMDPQTTSIYARTAVNERRRLAEQFDL